MTQQIFISYSRVDKKDTEDLIKHLGQFFPDIKIWHDKHLFNQGGQKWWDAILDAIEDSDIFLYLLSNDSIESPYCQAEFAEALRLERPFIAVQLRDRTKIPDTLAEYQYVDLANRQGEIEPLAHLTASIRGLLPEGARAKRKKFPKKNRTPRPVKQEEIKPAEREDVETSPLEVPSTGKSQNTENIWRFVGVIIALLVAAIGITPQLLDRQDRFNLTQTAAALTQIAQAPTDTATTDPVDATLTAIFGTMEVAGASTATTLAETQAVLANEQATNHAIETAAAIETGVAIGLATQITWTPIPSLTIPTNTPSLIPTVPANTPDTISDSLAEALRLAERGVTSNDEWTPYIQEFDGFEMVLVPRGCFIMGSTDEQIAYAVSLGGLRDRFADEQPAHQYCIDNPLWIDRYEVSNAQFAQFNEFPARSSNWSDANLPRENIMWYEARDFCALRESRLPTEAEWEYAARGPDSLVFPWGDEFDGTRANYCDSNCESNFRDVSSNDEYTYTAPINSFSSGVSWVGAEQMSGNVWEWVSTIYDGFLYPYTTFHGREDVDRTNVLRVLRGGSWDSSTFNIRAANRLSYLPASRGDLIGVRCARSL
jgi:formylglycine-generating enzyme required for sulfatase activity